MRFIVFFFFFLGVTDTISGQELTGTWNGLLRVQNVELRLVFNISHNGQSYIATMDSPDQGASGIPVDQISYEGGHLTLKITAAKIEYEGLKASENTIIGTFSQSGQSVPMDLEKVSQAIPLVKGYQNPIPPFPYTAENITFYNKKDKITLAGTLTTPAGKGPFPAVVLISGSGPQNRNSELMGHQPFLVLSDHLTKNGFAVLRYDDRGVGESGGTLDKSTSADFAKDAAAAVRFLKNKKGINSHKIGLIGHSEGGMIAPLVAAKSKDVAFIVLLAGPGVRGDSILLLQQEMIGRAQGASEADLKMSAEMNREIFNLVLQNKNDELLLKALTAYLTKTFESLPPGQLPQSTTPEMMANSTAKQLTSPWFYYFVRYDPAEVLEKVKCPVLAINGEKDLQVPADINLNAITVALKKGGNNKVTTAKMKGLNHLFQECETGSPMEYSQIEQTFSPAALDEITNWLKTQL